MTRHLTDEIVLKELAKHSIPISSTELGKELGASGPVVGKYLSHLADSGLAIRVSVERKRTKWLGGDEIIVKLVQAFPIIIAWYRRIDPKTAELLERDWNHLLESGFPQWEMKKDE